MKNHYSIKTNCFLAQKKRRRNTIFLRMKITVLLIFLASFSATAGLFGQTKINLSVKKASLETVLQNISNTTSFNILYSVDDILKTDKKISLNVKNARLEDVLDQCIKGSGLKYVITDNTVIISKASPRQKNFLRFNKTEPVIKENTVERSANVFRLINSPEQQKQPITIKGRVLAKDGNPIPGANVHVKGANRGTATDINGNFSIEVKENEKVLVFSYIGMKKIEVVINNQTTINVVMEEDIAQLNQVVVTGIQVQNKITTTGSFSSLKSEDIKLRSSIGLNRLLEGTIPGLSMYRGGIQIRGASSIDTKIGNQPLYIVDGFEVSTLPANMNDIENVTVLKDAAAASVWGSRAANGVVVMTTKKGSSKNGEVTINYNNSFKFTTQPDFDYLNRANSAQLIDYEKEAFAKGFITKNMYFGSKSGYSQSIEKLILCEDGAITEQERDLALNNLSAISNKAQIDEYLMRNAFQQNHYLSINGGSNKLSYLFSGSFNNGHSSMTAENQKGFILNSRASYTVKPFLTLRSDLSTTYNNSDNGYSGLSNSIQNLNPYQLLVDEQGKYIYDYTGFNKRENERLMKLGYFNNGINLLEETKLANNKTKSQYYRTKVGFDLNLIKGMVFSSDIQFEKSLGQTRNIQVANSNSTRMLMNQFTTEAAGKLTYNLPLGDVLGLSNEEGNRTSFRSQLAYNGYLDKAKKHYVNAIGGLEIRKYLNKTVKQRKLGYNDDLLSWAPIDQNVLAKTGIIWWDGSTQRYYAGNYDSFGEVEMREQSYYTSAVYTFDNRYNISTSFRIDESNLFGVSEKYRRNPLWSMGASWNINNEKFFNNENITQLKLRTTYGLTGNFDRSGSTTPILTATRFINTLTNQFVARIATPPNPSLRWEKTKTFNVGVDFEYQNRYFASVELYRKNSYDLLGISLLDPTVGFASAKVNAANMTNNGIEVTLRADVVKTNDFVWTSSFIFSYNKNIITENRISDGAPEINRVNGYNTVIKDYPRESLWSYKWAGLDNKGNPQTYDAKGDKILKPVLASLEYNGTTVPKFNGSFSNNLRYKNMQLMFFFVYNLGHKLRIEYPTMNPWSFTNNNLIADRWRKPGDENLTDIPSISEITAFYDGRERVAKRSSNSVIDGSFVRLREILFSYQLPNALCQKAFMKRISLTVQAHNLFIWTKNDRGIDPEAHDPISGSYSLPEPRSITFGVSVDL